MNTNAQPTPDRIMQLAWGFAPTLILEAAVKHHVFDHLDAGSKTAEQVAKESGASLRGIKAILNSLVGLGLLTRDGQGYKLAPDSAAFLVSTKPGYQGAFMAHLSQQLIPNWLKISDVVRTGKPSSSVNQEKDGEEFFAGFVEAIFSLSYAAAQKLGEHLEVAKTSSPISVLDIGAGSGVWGVALAQQSPKVRVRSVDWPRVLEVTEKVARKFGVADRLTKAPGDLLEADFGNDHQIATIGHILHSEGMDRSRRLLKRTFDALAPGGKIAVMEFVPNDDRTAPPMPLIFAVNMLVNTDEGDTFTFPEISAWLREAGFINPRQLDVPAVSPLILATKP